MERPAPNERLFYCTSVVFSSDLCGGIGRLFDIIYIIATVFYLSKITRLKTVRERTYNANYVKIAWGRFWLYAVAQLFAFLWGKMTRIKMWAFWHLFLCLAFGG